MLFNSALFIICFLPCFLAVYYLVPVRFKNHVALGGSFLFYAWGAPVFCFLLLASATLDHIFATQIHKGRDKYWLPLALLLNLGLLFAFKYFNFFVDNARTVADALGFNFPHFAEIALPLGLSFFTFQKISYLIDVHRRTTAPARSLADYWLYVFLFPQLIAGPIVRYKEISDQITGRFEQEYSGLFLAGFRRFVLGLTKKVLMADQLAPLADAAFTTPGLDGVSATVGLLAFTFQIYFDFSGYSDMAIGLGRMMGFSFPENFNWPYTAKGFREFWRRWHISLSTWMRDYLYVPLGGNLGGSTVVVRNLWVVFLLSGLWHGASWNFVVWGLWHGAFISLDRYSKVFGSLKSLPAGLLTFMLVAIGWIWFRAVDLSSALDYFAHFTCFSDNTMLEVSARQGFVLILAMVFSFLPKKMHPLFSNAMHSGRWPVMAWILSLLFLMLCLGQLAISQSQPFIYFKF